MAEGWSYIHGAKFFKNLQLIALLQHGDNCEGHVLLSANSIEIKEGAQGHLDK